jgi:hypothetical protein
LGTINYMAPEQARGSNRITPAADIYSVGSTMYAALTGRYYLPFRTVKGEFDYETMAYNFKLVKERDPDRPHRYNAAIGPILEGIVLRCLAKDPKDRYNNIEEVRAALNRVYTMLELERERDYQEAEAALGQGRWGQALKLYDRVLALDENYAEVDAHRVLARKWLGPADMDLEAEAKRSKETATPSAVVNQTPEAPQNGNGNSNGNGKAAEVVIGKRGDGVLLPRNQVRLWEAQEFLAGSNNGANNNHIEESVKLGPFSVVNGANSNTNGEQSAKKNLNEDSAALILKLWSDAPVQPYQSGLANFGASDSNGIYYEEESRFFTKLAPNRVWMALGVVLVLALVVVAIWFLTKPNPETNVKLATVIPATATVGRATSTAFALTPAITLLATTPSSVLSVTPALTDNSTLLTATPSATASSPTRVPTATEVPPTTTAPPAPEIKAFAAADSVDSNGNPGTVYKSYYLNDYIFIYLLISNPNNYSSSQFNVSVYSLPRVLNDRALATGTPIINNAGYVVLEQNAGDLKLGNFEAIFTFLEQPIANPIDFKVIPFPASVTPLPSRSPYIPPTPTPRPHTTTVAATTLPTPTPPAPTATNATTLPTTTTVALPTSPASTTTAPTTTIATATDTPTITNKPTSATTTASTTAKTP